VDLVPEIMVCPQHVAAGFMPQVQPEHAQNAEGAAVPTLGYSRPTLANAYAPPLDKTEIAICGIWQELLGIGQIGIHDNFFDLGGNSLIATQLLSRLRRNISPEISLRMVFDNLTVAELAAAIRSHVPIVFGNSAASEQQSQPLGGDGGVPKLRSRKARAKETPAHIKDEQVCGHDEANSTTAGDCAEELMAPSARGEK
jgi:acyl carrier protein